jgi:hypothetical protein
MSFTSQRANLADQLNIAHEVQGYEKTYLSKEVQSVLDDLGGYFIGKLYNDLLGAETTNDLKAFLNDFYKHANDYAKECLLIAIHPSHIFGKRLKSWTDHSLHAFDCFLIKLINEKMGKAIPAKKPGKIYETDTYSFLLDQGGDLQDIGQSFQSIYQYRNQMTHIQYHDDADGKRKIVHWEGRKFRQAKEVILSQYKIALRLLDKILTGHGI